MFEYFLIFLEYFRSIFWTVWILFLGIFGASRPPCRGQLCYQSVKPEEAWFPVWQPGVHSIVLVLWYLKSIFYKKEFIRRWFSFWIRILNQKSWVPPDASFRQQMWQDLGALSLRDSGPQKWRSIMGSQNFGARFFLSHFYGGFIGKHHVKSEIFGKILSGSKFWFKMKINF